MEEERQEVDFDLNLNEDPYNPAKSKKGLLIGIIAGVVAIIVIAWYISVTT